MKPNAHNLMPSGPRRSDGPAPDDDHIGLLGSSVPIEFHGRVCGGLETGAWDVVVFFAGGAGAKTVGVAIPSSHLYLPS